MTIYPVPKPKRKGRGSKRGHGLRRTPLKNRTPMKKRNAKRGGHAFPDGVNESYRRHIMALPQRSTE